MGKKKLIRTRGKLKFSRYFQELEKGDKVAVLLESAVQPRVPKRLQGRTGVVENRKGRAYVVCISDQDQVKKFLIEPIHLKKMKN